MFRSFSIRRSVLLSCFAAFAFVALALSVSSQLLARSASCESTNASPAGRLGSPLPALRGKKAVEHLKQTGQYDSLKEAVEATRKGQTEETPTNDAFGQTTILTASDGAAADTFGRSVAISGDTAIVGADFDDVGANANQGSAYVFVRSGSTWSEQQRLTASDGIAGIQFGGSVAISGETAVVGARFGGVGSAYVFVRSGTVWSEQQKLTAAAATGAQFGYSVGISGETAIIGAIFDNGPTGSPHGSAYIFVRSGTVWTEQQKLLASDGAIDQFGRNVGISGETAIIGALFNDVGANTNQGSAYVFVRSGTSWSELQRLTASDGAADDVFGQSVAIFGETVILGATGDDVGANTNQGSAYVFRVLKAPFDFDGDGKTDISISRPTGPGGAEWWWSRSSDSQVAALVFGSSTDRIAPADFTGDGKTDVAFFRPSTGSWFILRSENGTFYSFPWGTNGDVPVPADYDADGKADAAVYRPSNSLWVVLRSSDGQAAFTTFGTTGDQPVPADYDGDGRADVGIFRPSGGSGSAEWWIQRSTADLLATVFGQSTDRAVPGDYTGDGKADIAFWRPSTGNWFILRSEDFSFYAFPWGANGDTPAPGDYDGDGKTDAAVFRPASATWFVNRSTSGPLITAFGASGDTPVPSAYVR